MDKMGTRKLRCSSDLPAALVGAAKKGHVSAASFLLDRGVPRDEIDRHVSPEAIALDRQINDWTIPRVQSSPLVESALHGRDDVVRLLVQYQPELSRHHRASFCAACYGGHLDIARFLFHTGVRTVDHRDAPFSARSDIQNDDFAHALVCAASHGHTHVVRWCLQEPLMRSFLLQSTSRWSALLRAVDGSHYQVVEDVLDALKLSEIDIESILVDRGTTRIPVLHDLLVQACQCASIEMVDWLLKRGAELDKWVGYGINPLAAACSLNRRSVIEFLLSKGAKLNLYALHAAAQGTGGDELLLSLLQPNKHEPITSIELVVFASQNCTRSLEWIWIHHGALVQSNLHALVMAACRSNSLKTLQWLLDNGASPSDNENEALVTATELGHLPVVKELLSRGADPHAFGCRALNAARRSHVTELVSLFESCTPGHEVKIAPAVALAFPSASPSVSQPFLAPFVFPGLTQFGGSGAFTIGAEDATIDEQQLLASAFGDWRG